MAIQREDVQRLVDAHAKARQAVELGRLLEAAKILCSEFQDLLGRHGLWEDLEAGARLAQPHSDDAASLLEEVGRLIDEEAEVLSGLGIAPPQATAILRDVYAGRSLSARPENAQLDGQIREGRAELAELQKLICAESEKGAFRYACAWVMSETGVRIIADAATIAANVTVVTGLPHVTFASALVAVRVMRQDIRDCRAFLTYLKKRR